MRLGTNSFRGLMPRLDPRNLPAGAAASALNCDLSNGSLQAFLDTQFVTTPTKPGVKKTIYRFGLTGSDESLYWLTWTDDVDVAKGQIADDAAERTYYTGDTALGYPAVTDATLALTGGGSNYPIASYRLGVPLPAVAPTAVPTGTGTGSVEVRAYVYTYVTGASEEGQPSEATEVTLTLGQSVDVSGFAAPPAGYNVTSRRIYRAEVGDSGAVEYLFVAEIPLATTTFNDNFATADLAGTLTSIDYEPPPIDMRGLINMPNGMMAAFMGYDLLLCVPYRPYAWPTSYRQPTDFPIVGLGVHSDTLVLCTKGRPYIGVGTNPESLTLRQLELDEPCVAKRSIARTRDGVMYASPNGLVLVSPGRGAALVTDAIIDKLYWQTLNSSSIVGAGYDGRYIGFYDNGVTTGGFVFDPTDQTQPFSLIDITASAAYRDPARDELYLAIGSEIRQFEGNSQRRSFEWTSQTFVVPRDMNVGFGKVRAEAYPITMYVFADDVLVHTETVLSHKAFAMPSGRRASEWKFRLAGDKRVTAAYIASDRLELRGV